MIKKVKYFIKRLANMNYKKCFNTIEKIHKKTGKSKVFIFFDVIWCGLKYQAGYMDYWLFEMDTLNKDQRKTIVTRGKNNEIVKKYNNQNYIKYLNNKIYSSATILFCSKAFSEIFEYISEPKPAAPVF